MPTIHLEAQVSPSELLKAVERMSLGELEEFVSGVLTVRAQRTAPCLPACETELLRRINEGFPETLWNLSQELIAKRRAETLTPDEYAELLRVGDELEKLGPGQSELAWACQDHGEN